MATGRDIPTLSIHGGHEEVFDFNCDQCETEDKIMEATAYCPDCGTYFCAKCLALHSTFVLSRTHNVLDRSQVDKWGKKKIMECKEHDGQTVSRYCESHDAICCPVCLATRHRNCNSVQLHYIPKLPERLVRSSKYYQIESRIDIVLSTFETMLKSQIHRQNRLSDSRNEVLRSIADTRKKISEAFDVLEEKAKSEMEALNRTANSEIESDIDACNDFKSKLMSLKQQLYKAKKIDTAEWFVTFKVSQQMLSQGERLLQQLLLGKTHVLVFTANPKLKVQVQKLEKEILSYGITKTKELKQSVAEIHQQLTPQLDMPYTRNEFRITKQNIKVPSDLEIRTLILGMCQLPSGSILISDSANACVKQLGPASMFYSVVQQCSMPAYPRGICSTGDDEAAVALSDESIQFISAYNKLVTTRAFRTDHDNNAIAYHNGRLYISNEKNVYVHDMTGKYLFTIATDNNGSYLFSKISDLAVSADGNIVYLADCLKGLVTVNRQGKHLHTLTDTDLGQVASTVCLDNYGNVFVSDSRSGDVLQVDHVGRKVIGMIPTISNDQFDSSGAICFDIFQSSLIMNSGIQKLLVDALDLERGTGYDLNIYKLEQ